MRVESLCSLKMNLIFACTIVHRRLSYMKSTTIFQGSTYPEKPGADHNLSVFHSATTIFAWMFIQRILTGYEKQQDASTWWPFCPKNPVNMPRKTVYLLHHHPSKHQCVVNWAYLCVPWSCICSRGKEAWFHDRSRGMRMTSSSKRLEVLWGSGQLRIQLKDFEQILLGQHRAITFQALFLF